MFIIAYHFGFCGKHASYKGDGLYIYIWSLYRSIECVVVFSSSKEPKC